MGRLFNLGYEHLISTSFVVFGMDIGLFIIISFIGYLFGCVNTSIIISKLFLKKDIRDFGSGNAGLTNATRIMGKKIGIFVTLGDVLKCVIPGIIGGILGGYNGMAAAAFASVIGHIFPAFFDFKGGKGVLTGVTMIFMMDYRAFILAMAVFALMVYATRMISLSSITATISAGVFYFSFNPFEIRAVILVLIACLLVIFMHRENIIRIIKGTERKVGQKV